MSAVIFDLDGVVVSTDVFHSLAWKETAEEYGIPFDDAILDRLRGVSRLECAALILRLAGRPTNRWDVYTFAQTKNSRYIDYLNGLSPADILPGVEDLLESLKKSHIKTAIASSSKNTQMILGKIGMTDRFDVVVDGTMISRFKPDPEVFETAARLLHESVKQCIVIEDAQAGIQGARACGMFAVAVGPAGAAGCGDLNFQDLSGLTAKKLIDRMAQKEGI